MGGPSAASRVRADRWTFAVLTPDALVLGPPGGHLRQLEGFGLQAVCARLVRLRVPTMQRIYGRPGPSRPPGLPALRLFERWYAMGPACLVLLHRPAGSACASLLEAKGATDPARAAAGTVRAAAENVLMNLMHCPDDATAAHRELEHLLGPRAAARFLRAGDCSDERVRTLTVGALDEAVPARTGREALSTPHIVNRLRLRLVQQLVVHRVDDGDDLIRLHDVASLLADERAALRAAPHSPARTAAARARNGEIGSLLARASRTAPTRWQRANDALSAIVDGSAEPDAHRTVAPAGLCPTALELANLEITTGLR